MKQGLVDATKDYSMWNIRREEHTKISTLTFTQRQKAERKTLKLHGSKHNKTHVVKLVFGSLPFSILQHGMAWHNEPKKKKS